jgi:hypothetical protein
MKRSFLCLCVTVALTACGTDGDPSVETGDNSIVDETGDLITEDQSKTELPVDQRAPDLGLLDIVEVYDFLPPDLPESDQFEPLPGELGYPCTTSNDCTSGFCIQTLDGKQCTDTCIEDCPFNWECVLHAPSLPDEVFICAPELVNLCRPCEVNADCMANGVDTGEACIQYGPSGNFCGAVCENAGDCPGDYVCDTGMDVAGTEETFCLYTGEECPCAKPFVDAGATTWCYQENEFGLCDGQRSCMGAGLTPCDAATPASETCNGLDDDCDGDIDNDIALGECNVINPYGTCPGIETCTEEGIVCEGNKAKAELCDGEDNDCDGLIDEGFEDTDDDGIADCLENDKDGDGVVDGLDNCPSTFNPSQTDSDLDTVGDPCDPDDDNDQIADEDDCAPKDADVFPGNEEPCDGKDNNCNYLVDEGFADSDADGWKDCVDEDDDNDGSVDGLDCAPTDPTILPGQPELCDGKDNDCNGQIDEEFGEITCGKGGCIQTLPACLGGKVTMCDPLTGAAPEICDGADNDCDGLVDEDLGVTSCGLGSCAQTVANCMDGVPAQCDPLAGAGDEVCDGLDNDCDGKTDEEQPTLECGKGQCQHSVPSCIGGEVQLCDPLQGAQGEVCDGKDNDCDGKVDEDFLTVSCGKGLCFHEQGTCVDGVLQMCDPYLGAENEICDGLDNDCDGLTDEDLGKSTCGLGVCANTVANCSVGEPQECDPFQGVGEEVCDGLDNDCDGKTDEDQPTLACGKGQCFHSQASCIGGQEHKCNAFDGATKEVCDGQDNDCDGDTDEDLGEIPCGEGLCYHVMPYCTDGKVAVCNPFLGVKPEGCNGIDDDCNGLIDDGMGLNSCGSGTCFHWFEVCVEGELQECDPFEGAVEESCDGLDNDCDGKVDEADASDCLTYYVDADSDGFGIEGSAQCLCAVTPPYVVQIIGDCDDDNILVHPGMDENCYNDVDEDCSDSVNDGCVYKSCKEIRDYVPGSVSGEHTLDSDGAGPKPSFDVTCDMDTDGGGWTIFHHDTEAKTHVTGIEEPGAYSKDVTYLAPIVRIQEVMALSTDFRQNLIWDCKGSLLNNGGDQWYGYWLDTLGDKETGWPGGTAACDINDQVWRQSGGNITDADALPVAQLHFGDTGDGTEEGYHTLGPLWCR